MAGTPPLSSSANSLSTSASDTSSRSRLRRMRAMFSGNPVDVRQQKIDAYQVQLLQQYDEYRRHGTMGGWEALKGIDQQARAMQLISQGIASQRQPIIDSFKRGDTAAASRFAGEIPGQITNSLTTGDKITLGRQGLAAVPEFGRSAYHLSRAPHNYLQASTLEDKVLKHKAIQDYEQANGVTVKPATFKTKAERDAAIAPYRDEKLIRPEFLEEAGNPIPDSNRFRRTLETRYGNSANWVPKGNPIGWRANGQPVYAPVPSHIPSGWRPDGQAAYPKSPFVPETNMEWLNQAAKNPMAARTGQISLE
jgi:hypothetical protein